jgi:Fe-S-cluster-containing hydrogenase component 2
VTDLYNPLHSLREGHWFKLICGASFQHLPAVRNLTLAYALAGADCIDVAADPAVITVAQEALQAAANLASVTQDRELGFQGLPWLMVSLNDGEDPHFRKAEFDPDLCPLDCTRPCEAICPAEAIVFQPPLNDFSGVIQDRCYGCGRCLPLCPTQQISTRSYGFTPEAIAPVIFEAGIDAIEIHTQVGRFNEFQRLWQAIAPSVGELKLVAISCPDGEGLIDYLWALYDIIQNTAIAPPNRTQDALPCSLIWQTDGRPMSGDIGDGATRAAVKLGQKVLAANLPGYVQLAGGTNSHTVSKLRTLGLIKSEVFPLNQANADKAKHFIAGVAYGSYARVLLSPVLEQLELPELMAQTPRVACLEDTPTLLWQAVDLAYDLVSQLKSSIQLQQPISKQV